MRKQIILFFTFIFMLSTAFAYSSVHEFNTTINITQDNNSFYVMGEDNIKYEFNQTENASYLQYINLTRILNYSCGYEEVCGRLEGTCSGIIHNLTLAIADTTNSLNSTKECNKLYSQCHLNLSYYQTEYEQIKNCPVELEVCTNQKQSYKSQSETLKDESKKLKECEDEREETKNQTMFVAFIAFVLGFGAKYMWDKRGKNKDIVQSSADEFTDDIYTR